MRTEAMACALALIVGVGASPAAAEEMTVETKAGQAVIVAAFMSSIVVSQTSCYGGPLPRIAVTGAPTNGKVETLKVRATPGRTTGGTTYRCPGEKQANALVYAPRGGFRGVDRVSFTVTIEGGQYPMTSSYTASVAVK